jgi:hypothetical protein
MMHRLGWLEGWCSPYALDLSCVNASGGTLASWTTWFVGLCAVEPRTQRGQCPVQRAQILCVAIELFVPRPIRHVGPRAQLLRIIFEPFAQGTGPAAYEAKLLSQDWGIKFPMDREMCIAFEHPEGWLVRKKFDIVFGHRQRRIFEPFAQGTGPAAYEAKLLSQDWGIKFGDITYNNIMLWALGDQF